MKVQMVVLTKSIKYGGYCVAGITIDEHSNYIRLGYGVNCAELCSRELMIGNKEIMVLDKITVDVEKLPLKNPQIENYKLKSILSFDGKMTKKEFMGLIDT